jgi:hypothetical protein
MIIDYAGVKMHATNRRIFTVHALDYVESVSNKVNVLSIRPATSATRLDIISEYLTKNKFAWRVIYVANPEYDNIFEMFNAKDVYAPKYIRVPVSGFIDITSVDLQITDTQQQLIDLRKLPRVNYNFTFA